MIKTLLLGGGYVLQRVASLLPVGSFVITSRSKQRVAEFRSFGWISEVVSIEDISSLENLLIKYRDIEEVVDSIPPLHSLGEGKALIGVSNVGRLINKTGIDKVIYLSTTGVFGVEDGSWVDEQSDPKPNNSSSRLRLESEELYRSFMPKVCTMRIAAIYGPGRGIGTSIKSGKYRMINNFDRWSNRIHVVDLAKTISNVLQDSKDNSLPSIICISDNQPTLTSQVVSFYCREFLLPQPDSIDRSEVEKQKAWTMLSNQRVSNKLLRSTLLPELRFPTFIEGGYTEFMIEKI